jgi:hypothetical protein
MLFPMKQRNPSERADTPASNPSRAGNGLPAAGDASAAATAAQATEPGAVPSGAFVRRFRRGRWTLTPVSR